MQIQVDFSSSELRDQLQKQLLETSLRFESEDSVILGFLPNESIIRLTLPDKFIFEAINALVVKNGLNFSNYKLRTFKFETSDQVSALFELVEPKVEPEVKPKI